MTFQEYIEFTRTTDIYPEDKKLFCYVTGLVSEYAEFNTLTARCVLADKMPENAVKELGDICWFATRLTDYLDALQVWNAIIQDVTQDQLINALGKLSGIANKTIRDYNGLIPEHYRELATDYLTVVWTWIHYVCKMEDLDFGLVYIKNVHKIKDRKARNVIKGDGDNR